jgi:hypothetical protein
MVLLNYRYDEVLNNILQLKETISLNNTYYTVVKDWQNTYYNMKSFMKQDETEDYIIIFGDLHLTKEGLKQIIDSDKGKCSVLYMPNDKTIYGEGGVFRINSPYIDEFLDLYKSKYFPDTQFYKLHSPFEEMGCEKFVDYNMFDNDLYECSINYLKEHGKIYITPHMDQIMKKYGINSEEMLDELKRMQWIPENAKEVPEAFSYVKRHDMPKRWEDKN